MSLIDKFDSPMVDIVGDIHGEYDALISLMDKLGYDENGFHPQSRKLVFVGDLVDRGPDSIAVILFVKKLCELGNAKAVLGNHELSVLLQKPKDGSNWFFDRNNSGDDSYEPYRRATDSERREIHHFLNTLPVGIELNNISVVHAAWHDDSIAEVRKIPIGSLVDYYQEKEEEINTYLKTSGLLDNYHKEYDQWKSHIHDETAKVPVLKYVGEYNMVHQMKNPVRIITSGLEELAPKPFFTYGKWRFVQRNVWWNNFEENRPVVVGHFWRKFYEENTGFENMFANTDFNGWHGKKHNVFCVDYSVGARFKERNKGLPLGSNTKLAALRMPENKLVFENGKEFNTTNFLKKSYFSMIKFGK